MTTHPFLLSVCPSNIAPAPSQQTSKRDNPILHKNQYGFIKGKSIHDSLGWAFEYLQICHLSKRPIIIMKIDFEKAFDKVEYNVIISMCKALGFGT
jgi:hypothetical protein